MGPRGYDISCSPAHAFQASQLFGNCALASSSVATLSERAIGGATVSDQNQRRWSGPTSRLIDATDCPPAAVDGEVWSVLVDPDTESGRAECERHSGSSRPEHLADRNKSLARNSNPWAGAGRLMRVTE